MGSAITINRLFAYAPDQALAVTGAELSRAITYSGNWSRIRLGMLVAVQRNSNSVLPANPNLWLGIGSGLPASAYSTRNFVGVSLFGSPAAPGAWAYTSNAFDYVTSATAGYQFRKYDTTITLGTQITGGNTLYLPLTADSTHYAHRVPFIIDIIRPLGGSGNATLSFYFIATSTTTSADFRPDHLFQAIDNVGTPTINGFAMTVGLNAVAVPLGEEFGPLDTISLYWNKTTIPLEIYALGASVMADTNPTYAVGGAYDGFEAYNAGTLVTGMTPFYGSNFNVYPVTGTLNVEQGFSGSIVLPVIPPAGYAGTVYGNAGSLYGASGTSLGSPYDTFDAYSVGTATPAVLVGGTGWSSAGQFGYWAAGTGAGFGSPTAQQGSSGTSAGWPYDTFDSYAVGPVVSGSTINAGIGWSSNGIIY